MGFEKARREMVRKISGVYGLKSPEVLSVMEKVPRHKFITEKLKNMAYKDLPVDIGYGQTISQPFTVAVMSSLITENSKLKLKNQKLGKVLEIGTGSGYQAAVLSYFFDRVYSLEIVHQLADRARKMIVAAGYKNVSIGTGSGKLGWKEHSPYDAIMITAGVRKVPQELFSQLKSGGVLVAPVGEGKDKTMTKFTKTNSKLQITNNKSKLNSKAIKTSKSEYLTETFGTFHFVPFVTDDIRDDAKDRVE